MDLAKGVQMFALTDCDSTLGCMYIYRCNVFTEYNIHN